MVWWNTTGKPCRTVTLHSRGPMSIAMIGPPRELGSLCTQFQRDGPLTHLLFLASSLLPVASLLRFAASIISLCLHSSVLHW
jgi:hypothetical protein